MARNAFDGSEPFTYKDLMTLLGYLSFFIRVVMEIIRWCQHRQKKGIKHKSNDTSKE